MSGKIEKDVQIYQEQLDYLQDALICANENGLLQNDMDAYNEILNIIMEAIQDSYENPPNILGTRKKFGLAYYKLNQAINSTSIWWRISHVYGIPLLLYFSILFIAWIVYSPRILDVDIYIVPGWAFSWGLLGSVLQGLWFVCENIWKKSLRKCWFVWFLILPLFGAISGALTYLIFQAGLIASTGDVTLQSDVFPMLLSALAGFGSRKVVGTFSELVKKIG